MRAIRWILSQRLHPTTHESSLTTPPVLRRPSTGDDGKGCTVPASSVWRRQLEAAAVLAEGPAWFWWSMAAALSKSVVVVEIQFRNSHLRLFSEQAEGLVIIKKKQ